MTRDTPDSSICLLQAAQPEAKEAGAAEGAKPADGEASTAPPRDSKMDAGGLFGAFGKRHYEGGFDEKMSRKEVALVLGVRESAAPQRIKVRLSHRRWLFGKVGVPDTGLVKPKKSVKGDPPLKILVICSFFFSHRLIITAQYHYQVGYEYIHVINIWLRIKVDVGHRFWRPASSPTCTALQLYRYSLTGNVRVGFIPIIGYHCL